MKAGAIAASLFALILLTAPVSSCMMMGGGMMGKMMAGEQKSEETRGMSQDHVDMMREIIEMMQEMMEYMKAIAHDDLNRQKMERMIKKVGEMKEKLQSMMYKYGTMDEGSGELWRRPASDMNGAEDEDQSAFEGS